MPIRVAINGFGRIGRCLTRQLVADDSFEIACINDIVPDIDNLAYLYNYDSSYGRAPIRAHSDGLVGKIQLGRRTVAVHHVPLISDLPWMDLDVDILVDASGVQANVDAARELVGQYFKKAIITHWPKSGTDKCIILGVNEDTYDQSVDNVVSASICDANAIAHPIKAIDDTFGVTSGFVTTLHPWLSYQRLVDGTVPSQSYPGMFWQDFSLGRASSGALIPKKTTAVEALAPVLPALERKIKGFSYRVPTQVVCSSDIILQVGCGVTEASVNSIIDELSAKSPYVAVNEESLTSVDYLGDGRSAIIDKQWTQVEGNMLRIVVWYDNEWGYASRVKDLISFL